MNWLERHLAIFPVPELIMVVGAGQGRDLPTLMAGADTRLVLVEPQSRWADALRRDTRAGSRVEVFEGALDHGSGAATLKVFNFPELSSLNPDEHLLSLLPGARQTAELEVVTRSLADLVNQFDVPCDSSNWLIVDTAGIEAAVLSALTDEDVRRRFGHIVLRTSQNVRVEENTGVEPLLEAFIERGFRVVGTEDRSDGDWPRLHLQHVGQSAKRRELESVVGALRKQSEELAVSKSELQEQLEHQRLEFNDRMSRLDEELRCANRDAEERLATLTADLEQSKGALEEGKRLQQEKLDEFTATLGEKARVLSEVKVSHDEQRNRLQSDLDEARSNIEAQRQEISAISADLRQKCEQLKEFESSAEHARARIETLERSIEENAVAQSEATDREREHRERLEANLERAHSDLAVALRVQSLRDTDLKELQERYGQLLEQRDQQHDLLVQLTRRLGSASEFLKQLNAPDGQYQQGDSAVAEGLSRALSGELEA